MFDEKMKVDRDGDSVFSFMDHNEGFSQFLESKAKETLETLKEMNSKLRLFKEIVWFTFSFLSALSFIATMWLSTFRIVSWFVPFEWLILLVISASLVVEAKKK